MRINNLKTILGITAVLLAVLCSVSAAKIIYVDDDATGANNGSSWENAYIYLQEALVDADSSKNG